MIPAKVRTLDLLDKYLTDELVRRRAELFHLKARLETKNILQTEKEALLRGCIVVLYAHWEGYIKDSATAYICYVSTQKLKHRELSNNFVAVALRHMINDAAQAKTYKLRSELARVFLEDMESRSQINWKDVVITESNLSSDVLKNIIDLLGLDYLPEYETRQNVIDNQLLRHRNMAAHGQLFLEMDVEGFQHVYDTLLGGSANNPVGLMTIFKDQILNAVLLRKYLR